MLKNLKFNTLQNSIILFLGFCLVLMACKPEKYFTGKTQLKFLDDTIWFDTVFTKKPGSTYPISVTRITAVKNNEKSIVNASFQLKGGKTSPYKINVNGIAGPNIENIEILPGDSVFVFIQCKLEPNNQLNPILVLDSLISNVNGAESKLLLAAYGWDATYLKRPIITTNITWDITDKPYVVLDTLYIADGATLTIKPGVEIYASARTPFYVAGAIDIQGEPNNRVLIRGDKPTYYPSVIPNQWTGIHFLKGYQNGRISYTDITNAAVGIRVDSLASITGGGVELHNTKIQYCGQACLIGISAHVTATNCLFADAGSYAFLGFLGGNYSFMHCTFAEYSGFSSRQNGLFGFTNTQRDGLGNLINYRPLELTVFNSIIYGYNSEEIDYDKTTNTTFQLDFRNNFIRSKNPNSILGTENTLNKDPKFKSTADNNYQIDTLSPVIGKGIILGSPVTDDLLGKIRKPNPDIGCYERIP